MKVLTMPEWAVGRSVAFYCLKTGRGFFNFEENGAGRSVLSAKNITAEKRDFLHFSENGTGQSIKKEKTECLAIKMVRAV